MKSAEEHARATDGWFAEIANTVRRMAITLTTQALWQLAGVRNLDGSTETINIEPFLGIGLFARPPSSGSPEAIVVFAGGPKAGAIVAVRDEKTRQAIAGALAQDETMLFNSKAVVYAKADGTIEARSASGVALELATKADVTALANFVQALFVGGSGSAVVPPGTVPQPAGTTVFKAE